MKIPKKYISLQIIKKFKHMNKETGVKLLQYLMLCVLLYLCFVLPRISEKKHIQESAQGNVQQETSTQTENSSNTIVIDAGHGGQDPGMIGGSGINEKVLNLVYAQKLKTLLEDRGYRVVMTRDTEEGLYDENVSNKKAQDMQRRVALIEETAPLLTISIHQNSYPDASVAGPQVFYFQHSVEGEKLAASIQNAMNTELATVSRTHKGNTSYYILKRSSSVTVIVECGFLSNPQEEARLQDESYQDQVAQAICDGVMEYLGQPIRSLQIQ